MSQGLHHNAKDTGKPKAGEATPGKHNFDIQPNAGALQGATQAGMSPLSLMEAKKSEAEKADNPLLQRMYPSSTK